jgi:hypothetical protein
LNASHQYLQRYAEPEARALLETGLAERWQNVLVIPAYKESPEFLGILAACTETLLILVLNRPDSDTDPRCNDALRAEVLALPELRRVALANARLLAHQQGNHLLVIERPQPLPRDEGVGLARKIGCDAALALGAMGCIASRWIHGSDADAKIPSNYFDVAADDDAAIALTYPYQHTHPSDARERTAIKVYERYLQHYVDGLRYAGSPYAFHTLGSCIAVDASAYAKVRGFPRRAGGEDFYLLNKLVKHGAVVTPDCAPIRLSARLSQRVPFGTGPALLELLKEQRPQDNALFYHPRCFEGLRVLINAMRQHGQPGMAMEQLLSALCDTTEVSTVVQDLKIEKFLEHARQQCADRKAFQRQFDQWLDGFRTLKLIHALCEHWGRVTLVQLEELQPNITRLPAG